MRTQSIAVIAASLILPTALASPFAALQRARHSREAPTSLATCTSPLPSSPPAAFCSSGRSNSRSSGSTAARGRESKQSSRRAVPAICASAPLLLPLSLSTASDLDGDDAGIGGGAQQDGLLASYTDPRRIARAVLPSVALVTPVGVRNATSRGSGFVVDFPPSSADGMMGGSDEEKVEGGAQEGIVLHMLTAAHVAQPGHRLEVSFPSSGGLEAESARVVGRDARADLALLRVILPATKAGGDGGGSATPPPPLKISDADEPEVGTPTFAVGYPSGGIRGAAMTSGIVSASAYGLGYFDVSPDDDTNGEEDEAAAAVGAEGGENKNGEDEDEPPLSLPAFSRTSFVVTDAAMAGGMSGGPLVDGTTGGTVLGVNALVRPDLRALGNYAVDASECRSFLSGLAERLLSKDEEDAAGGGGELSDEAGKGKGYRVMLYNDRFNKRARVAEILASVGLNETEADKAMMTAHTRGKSVVRTFPRSDEGSREAALEMCKSLREKDVLVEVESS